MTPKSAKSRKSNDLSRCRHLFPGGRRCRLPLAPSSPHYCGAHSYLQPPAGAVVDLAPELTDGVAELNSASQINHFLSRLLVLLSEDRISPRRAAVLAYICNLLLRTLPAIELERHPRRSMDGNVEIVWDKNIFPEAAKTLPQPFEGAGQTQARHDKM
jgi:hypothetical protein